MTSERGASLCTPKRTMLALLAALALAGCSEKLVAPEPSKAQPAAVAVDATGMPTNREIFGYIQDLTSFGPRVTGSEAGIAAANYIAAKFREFGLVDVGIETGDALQWHADTWSLSYGGVDIPSFYMRHSFTDGTAHPFSTGPDGLNAQFVYVGAQKDLTGIDVRGKIVVADIPLTTRDEEDWTSMAYAIHDPKKNLAEASADKVNVYSTNIYPFNMASAMKNGAVGFVGILANYIDSNRYHNEELAYLVEEDLYFDIPGLWLTREDGERLKALIAQQPTAGGKLRLEGKVAPAIFHTVVGYLPGMSDETVMVQSHHDSGFLGAVEDASGVSGVMALAKYYGQQSKESRKRRMMFATMDTHFTEYESHVAFVEKFVHGPERKNIVANVTIEHIAREMKVGANGKPYMTEEVEPRLILASPSFLDLTTEQVKKHDYERSIILNLEPFVQDEWGMATDAGILNASGNVPVISLVTSPVYLYDMADTIDKVAVEELQPTALLFRDIVDAIDEMPLEAINKGNKVWDF